MNDQIVITSADKESTVVIDKGELISYSYYGEELIHQKGDRGWKNADTEMFPIIGPTASNNFRVNTKRGEAIQDQHGLLRELDYETVEVQTNAVKYQKDYKENTAVPNSKYPDNSSEAALFWPFHFQFQKHFHLSDESLTITFKIDGENDMPFMLGYHPAFKLSGNNDEYLTSEKTNIKLQDVIDVGSIALKVLDTDSIKLFKANGFNVKIDTKGFDNFMLWTEVKNMICIEPITAYPYTGEKGLSETLFNTSDGTKEFMVEITPFS